MSGNDSGADAMGGGSTTFMLVGEVADCTANPHSVIVAELCCMKCSGRTLVTVNVVDKKSYVDFERGRLDSSCDLVKDYGNCSACNRKFTIRVYPESEKTNNNNNAPFVRPPRNTGTFMVIGDITYQTACKPPAIVANLCCMKCGGHTLRTLIVEEQFECSDFKKNEHSCNVRVKVDYGSCSVCKVTFKRRIYSGETTTLARGDSLPYNPTPLSLEGKKEYLMEMVEISIGDSMWSKNGHHAQGFRGKGYTFNTCALRVKIDKKRFKLALVDDSDDDSDGDESDGEGDSGEWVCVKETKRADASVNRPKKQKLAKKDKE